MGVVAESRKWDKLFEPYLKIVYFMVEKCDENVILYFWKKNLKK